MVGIKTANLDKTQALNVIYGFFKQVQEWCAKSNPIQISEVEKHLSSHFQIISNGKPIGKNSADYLKRLQQFQKQYNHFDISKPVEEPIICGNQIAVHYKVNLQSRSGQAKEVQIMAIATIEENRVAKWSQVACEQGTGKWDQ